MMATHTAISRFQRDLTLSSVVKITLLVLAGLSILLGPVMERGVEGTSLLIGISTLWLFLSHRSARGSKRVMEAPSMIITGRLDEAERQIDQALRGFSLFRSVKLLSLHYLAMLRHSQQRWDESADLCRALLRQKLGGLKGLAQPSRMMMVDSLLNIGDLAGAYEGINGLYQQRLPLGGAMQLLKLQLDYESRVGAWSNMATNITAKTQMAELMNTHDAAFSQALLALAAKKIGRNDWSEWLKRRVELLLDVQELSKDRPLLWELWPVTPE